MSMNVNLHLHDTYSARRSDARVVLYPDGGEHGDHVTFFLRTEEEAAALAVVLRDILRQRAAS